MKTTVQLSVFYKIIRFEILTISVFMKDAAGWTSFVCSKSWTEKNVVSPRIATLVVYSLADSIIWTSILCRLYRWKPSITIIVAVFFIHLFIFTRNWNKHINLVWKTCILDRHLPWNIFQMRLDVKEYLIFFGIITSGCRWRCCHWR